MVQVPTRRFGRTELQLPIISCGGTRYSYTLRKEAGNLRRRNDLTAADIPDEIHEGVSAIVNRSLELGINHFETAHGYGSSEVQLGQALSEIPRDKFVLQTKVGPTAGESEFLTAFHKSLDRLQVDYLDLFTLHGINNDEQFEQTFRNNGCLDWAYRLKDEGLCRYIGFSTHGPTDRMCRVISSDRMDYIFLHWYFVDNRNWHAIELANQHDMGVYIISPNDQGGRLYRPSPKLEELCKPLTPMAFNLLWCLARPQVHSLALGPDRPENFDAHINAISAYYNTKRGEELIQSIATRLKHEINSVMGDGWYDTFHIGIPDYDEVPGEMNLIHILRVWGFAKSLDMYEFAKWKYNMLGNGSHWFPGNNAAQIGELDISDAIKNNPFADALPRILTEAHNNLIGEPVKRLTQGGRD